MISKKTKYALKALTILAERYGEHRPILISHLASQERIPRKFLELILLELKNKGILESKKGKGGGYSLGKSPDQITLGSVLRILEGPLSPLPCLSQTAYRKCEECVDEQTCGIRLVMKDLYDATVNILDRATLQDILDRSKGLQTTAMYFI